MSQETFSKYCSGCIMKEGSPGVQFSEDGLCNQCRGEEVGTAVKNMRHIIRDAMAFESYLQKGIYTKEYSYLLMLSGGKDSINILRLLVDKYPEAKPIAFTVNHPFESSVAIENIEKCIKKLDIEHIIFTPKVQEYKQIMKGAFTSRRDSDTSCGRIATSKIPCLICTAFMQIKSYLFAAKMEIPYLLYCADPFQMTHIQKDMELVTSDIVSLLGEEKALQIFGPKFELMIKGKWDLLPKIIYPYALVNNYNADKIVEELKSLGIYEGSPAETHCSLYSILNYYSLKHFDMPFYAPEIAYDVRSGLISREDAIKYCEGLKDIVINIVSKENITEQEKQLIRDTISLLAKSESQMEYQYENILNLKNIVDNLGFKLSEV